MMKGECQLVSLHLLTTEVWETNRGYRADVEELKARLRRKEHQLMVIDTLLDYGVISNYDEQ